MMDSYIFCGIFLGTERVVVQQLGTGNGHLGRGGTA